MAWRIDGGEQKAMRFVTNQREGPILRHGLVRSGLVRSERVRSALRR